MLHSTVSLLLLDFLFEIPKQIRVEKLLYGDIHAIAKFFDGGNCSTVIAPADDIIDRGLCDSTHIAQLIDGYIPLAAQLQNAFLDCLSNIHGYHLDPTY